MHDTSFAEESPVEGACHLLEFDGETAIRSRGEGVGITAGSVAPLLAGPVVPEAPGGHGRGRLPRAFGDSTPAVMGRRTASMCRASNVVRGLRQILSFHVPSVARPVGCSARALEARTAVQRKGKCTVRSFACERAGDSCESRRATTARGCGRWWSCRLVGQPHARDRALRCLVGLPSSAEGEVDRCRVRCR
jgi:hypothetical protein